MALERITVRQEGDRVLLIFKGRLVATMPWKAADTLARAILGHARSAEAFEVLNTTPLREQLYRDQQSLLSAGIPINLGVPRDELRKMTPPLVGIDSLEAVGRPRLVQSAPLERV